MNHWLSAPNNGGKVRVRTKQARAIHFVIFRRWNSYSVRFGGGTAPAWMSLICKILHSDASLRPYAKKSEGTITKSRTHCSLGSTGVQDVSSSMNRLVSEHPHSSCSYSSV